MSKVELMSFPFIFFSFSAVLSLSIKSPTVHPIILARKIKKELKIMCYVLQEKRMFQEEDASPMISNTVEELKSYKN